MHYAIIAAGEGSRLREEGIDVPKPLVRLGGVTLLGRLIDIFRSRDDCDAVSVIINPTVKDYMDTHGYAQLGGQADNVVVASTKGSMQSLHRLAPKLNGCGRFCLTTVDTVFRPDEFDAYMDAFSSMPLTDGCMGVTAYVDDEKPLYVGVGRDGDITGYHDTCREDTGYVSAGIYALPEHALGILDGCMAAGVTRMRDYQRALLASGMRLKAYRFGKVIDIDHASDITKALDLIIT